jgi:hypothetical protein
LKEKAIITKIGTYKKENPKARLLIRNIDRFFMRLPPDVFH